MEYDIHQYSDRDTVREYGMDIDYAVEYLIYYDDISKSYSEQELYDMLQSMRVGDTEGIRGIFTDYKITRSK